MFGLPSRDEIKQIFQEFFQQLGLITNIFALPPDKQLEARVENLENFVKKLGGKMAKK